MVQHWLLPSGKNKFHEVMESIIRLRLTNILKFNKASKILEKKSKQKVIADRKFKYVFLTPVMSYLYCSVIS